MSNGNKATVRPACEVKELKIDQVHEMYRVSGLQVTAVRIEIPTREKEIYVDGEAVKNMLVRSYGLRVIFHIRDSAERVYRLSRSLIEMYLTPKFGGIRIDYTHADEVLRGEMPALSLIMNEIIDPELRPRDPDYMTKVMAAIALHVELVRDVTAIWDLSLYSLFLSPEGDDRTEIHLSEEYLEKKYSDGLKIGFKPSSTIPSFITGF